MFTSVFRSSTPAGCHVEINFHGDTYVFLLPYDTHTALFFSQLTLAKDKYRELYINTCTVLYCTVLYCIGVGTN